MTKNKILSFYFSLLFLGCMCFFLKTATVEFANKSSVISLKSISYLRTNDGVTGWDEFSVLKDDAGIVILSADTTLTYDAALTDLVINNSNAILSLENTTVIINNNLNKSLYGYEIDTSGIDFWRIAAGTSKPTTGRSVWGVGSIGLGLNLYAHKLTTTFEWVQITNSPGAFDATQVDVSVSKIDRNYVAIVVNENRAYYCTNASGNTSGINTTPTWIGPMENLGTPFTSCRRVAIGSNANNLYIIDSSRVYKRNTDTSFTDLGPVADDISVDINDKLWSVMSNSSNLNRYTGSGASWEVMGSVPNGKDLTNVSAYDENRVLVTDEDGQLWMYKDGAWSMSFVTGYASDQILDMSFGSPDNIWVVDQDYKLFGRLDNDALEVRVQVLEESNTHTHNMNITHSIRIGGVLLDDGTIERSGDITITDPGIRVPPGYEDVVVEIYG